MRLTHEYVAGRAVGAGLRFKKRALYFGCSPGVWARACVHVRIPTRWLKSRLHAARQRVNIGGTVATRRHEFSERLYTE